MAGELSMPLGHKDPCVIVKEITRPSGVDRDVPNIRAAMQHGALFYIVKPFRLAAFRERLDAYARLRATMAQAPELSQADIDNAFGSLRTTPPDLPKGLSAQTLHAIEQTLHQADETLSSEAVAHLTGVSRVTARRYLIYLVESGRAEVHSEYGTPGRPTHLYSLLGPQDAEKKGRSAQS